MVLPSFVPPVAPLVLQVLRKKLVLVGGTHVTLLQIKDGVLLPFRPARLADPFGFPAVPEESLGGQEMFREMTCDFPVRSRPGPISPHEETRPGCDSQPVGFNSLCLDNRERFHQ